MLKLFQEEEKFHRFQSIAEFGMIQARRITSDETPVVTFNLRNKQQTLFGCYIA